MSVIENVPFRVGLGVVAAVAGFGLARLLAWLRTVQISELRAQQKTVIAQYAAPRLLSPGGIATCRCTRICADGVPTGVTKTLNDMWPDVAGFQLFLREAEYVRLQHDHNPYDSSLPYCLALGLDPGFIKNLAAGSGALPEPAVAD